MNLGDSDLKTVNTSRPQLVKSTSKQSVTASDDYYSLTEESSGDDRTTVLRYETPPMHRQPSRDALQSEAKQSEATIPTIRPVKHKDPDDEEMARKSGIEGHKIKRKPVSSSSSSSEGTVIRKPIDEVSPPTPGVDDTPYVHFAIDQITRDQEVTYQDGGSEASYPVERNIADEGLGYYPSRNYNPSRAQRPQDRRSDPDWRQQAEPPTDNGSILLPTEPLDPFRHPKLDFIPQSLRLVSLGALIFCCLLMVAALLFCAIWPTTHSGLWTYDGVSTGRYFVFQYFPTLLAIIIIVWLLVIQNAIYRIFPFVHLSSEATTPNSSVLHDSTIFPTNFIVPRLDFFRHKEPFLGVSCLIFWLSLFTVPLQSCLFQTRYYTPDSVWRWTALVPVAYVLVVLYLFLILALILLILRFSLRRETGLKWDPVSLADMLTLFQQANFLSDFDRSEVEGLRHSPYFSAKHLRLGYWRTSRHESEAFYGVAEGNSPTQRYSLERGKLVPVTDLSNLDLEAQMPEKRSTMDTLDTLRRDIHTGEMRYRWLPWFLRDGPLVAWILIAFALMIAFIVVSLVNNAVQRGFLPQLPAPTTSEGFSPANFLYSFIPSIIGMLLFLGWQPIDMYFRALQPFANLASDDGCSAEQSLLLSYTSLLPLEISFRALVDRHYKVAWISFISLLSMTLPVLAGGVFTAQFVVSNGSIRMAADMSGYYALVVFVVIYALSFLVIWPGRKRELPHDISTVGHLVSFFYQSPLRADAVFNEPRSKIDLVTRLVGRLTGEKGFSRYAFGVFTGLDGKEHLGIKRLENSTSFGASQAGLKNYTRNTRPMRTTRSTNE